MTINVSAYNNILSIIYTAAYVAGKTLTGGCTATGFETTWTNGLCWLVIVFISKIFNFISKFKFCFNVIIFNDNIVYFHLLFIFY